MKTRYRYLLSSMSIRDAVCHVLGNTCVKQVPGTLFLGKISQNRAQDMRREVKALFYNMPDDIVKSIMLQNSGFQLSML